MQIIQEQTFTHFLATFYFASQVLQQIQMNSPAKYTSREIVDKYYAEFIHLIESSLLFHAHRKYHEYTESE